MNKENALLLAADSDPGLLSKADTLPEAPNTQPLDLPLDLKIALADLVGNGEFRRKDSQKRDDDESIGSTLRRRKWEMRHERDSSPFEIELLSCN